MQIERLRLKNFRCYDELDIDFEPRLTVIVGENGKGKTAILMRWQLLWSHICAALMPVAGKLLPRMCDVCLFIKMICVILMVWNAIIR